MNLHMNMTRFGLCVLAAGLFLSPVAEAQEELLRIEASAVPRRLSPGEEGRVVLKLGVEPGIVVLPHPEFIVEFKPGGELIFPKDFFTAADLGVPTLEKDGQPCLGFDQPLRIPLTVSPKARRGSFILEGRIRYCARSAAEGWCVKNTAKFYVAYSTRPAAGKSP